MAVGSATSTQAPVESARVEVADRQSEIAQAGMAHFNFSQKVGQPAGLDAKPAAARTNEFKMTP